ncbi:BRCT domain-containing protein [Gautieria morchelliformis]|nr:BRCT domain-containing protein [Gautieria morchelliformis]
MPLFENITYHLSTSLAEDTRLQISRILDSNGATAASNIDLATHILSDTTEFEGCDSVNLSTSVACPYWVERSMELGHLQDPKYFSADKDMFFSGVVATSADLPNGDKEVIASGILAQGGAWRQGLTRDVTHLFVTNTRSEKYLTAMHFRESAHITVVLPQWFDQCWSTQMRLPSEVFQFPDPPYLRGDHDIAAYKDQMLLKTPAAGSHHLESGFDKQAMYGTMQMVGASSPLALRDRNIWEGRSIMLSPSLELDAQRRESVESRIRRSGGVVVIAEEEDESVVVEQADIFITRFRTGAAYGKALAAGKTVGTLAWLFYVERTGIMSRPRDQLLHYPVRSTPIQGFSDHQEITVTNYQGDAREYLKKLIEVMGAKFTPTMSGRNTIVIAAYKCGKKTAKAEEWSVPVVTHKWLEDCFVEWRNLTPAQKKYLDYAAGVNYGTILGDRGVGRVGLEEDPELSLPEITKEPALQPNHPNDEKPTPTKAEAIEATEHASAATPKSRNSGADTPARAPGAAGRRSLIKSPSPPEGGPDAKVPAATGAARRSLIKLGVKFIQKPHGCTHLVTNGLSRTEKFLCALPHAPYVLSMDWLTACAESGRIVAEDDYTLQDPDMEHKHKFKLVEALDRARELKRHKRKLLQGHFFYVTPGVPSDFNTLKKVLQALGAECRETVPTTRNVSDTRHVISSLKDEALWRPLVKHGVTIYSHELVLGAAFTQFVDWDGEDKILARGD